MKIICIITTFPRSLWVGNKSFPTFNHFSHRYCSMMEELGHETELLYLGRNKKVKNIEKILFSFL